MFDIGWTEMLVIAVVMIVVVGPKDLPKMLRTFGKTTAKMRAMAGDFQRQFNEALKEAELDDVKKSVDQLRSLNPTSEIKKQLNPFEKAAAEVRAGLDSALKPSKPPEPAPSTTQPAEPLKNGATAMPGVAGPETMPPAPVFTPAAEQAPAVAAAETTPAAAKPRRAPAKRKDTADKAPNGEEPAAKAAPKRKPRSTAAKAAEPPADLAASGSAMATKAGAS